MKIYSCFFLFCSLIGCAFVLSNETSAQVNALRLRVNGEYFETCSPCSDELVVRFHQDASMGFDGDYDAYKLFSPSPTAPSFWTQSEENYPLSINALPQLLLSLQKEVYLTVGVEGFYRIEMEEVFPFCSSTTILLEDLLTEEVVPFGNGQTLDFYAVPEDGPPCHDLEPPQCLPRFRLHFNPLLLTNPPLDLGNDIVAADGVAILLDAGEGFLNYKWSTGHEEQTLLVDTSGNYSVAVLDPNGCSAVDSIGVLFDSPTTFFHAGAHSTAPKFKVFPNPASDYIDVSAHVAAEEATSLRIQDAFGRVLLEMDLPEVISGGEVQRCYIPRDLKGWHVISIGNGEWSQPQKIYFY